MKKSDIEFSNKLKGRFKAKQDQMPKQAGIMGSSDGTLRVPNLDGYIYVTIGDKTVPVYNSLVTPAIGKKVWVGYTSVESKLYQVLSTRSEKPTGDQVGIGGGYAPSKYYEWLAKNGGQDPLHVHLRAISYLKIGVSATGGLNIQLYKGFVNSGGTFLHVDTQDLDLTAHVPATTGNAALVLITIDDTGAVVQTKGTEFAIADIAYTDIPAVPADTVFVCGAARVYNGQTVFQERKTNTDFIDLRFTGLNWGGGGGSLISGTWNHRGSFNASGGAYPSTGGSGTAGAIMSGDAWVVSVQKINMPINQPVSVGDVLVALVDSATNTQADWLIIRNGPYRSLKVNIETSTPIEGIWYYATDDNQLGYYNGTAWKWGVPFDEVFLPTTASPSISTYLSAQDDFVVRGSAGVIDGDYAFIVANGGAGTHHVDVRSGDGGYIRSTNDPQGDLLRTKWIVGTGFEVPNPSTGTVTIRFYGVSYLSGTPQAVESTSYNWNFNTTFPLGCATWDGTTLRIFNEPAIAGDVESLTRQNLRNTHSFQREKAPGGTDGLVISDVATRQIAMTAGVLWRDLNNYSLSAVSAGTAFTTHYIRSGGGFNSTGAVTQWPNDKYDDSSGTLATMTAGKYACHWVYVDVADGALNVIYGRAEYDTITDAQAEQEPTTAPNNIIYHGCLLGRIIFQKSASAAALVESIWKHNQTYVNVSEYGKLLYGNGVDGAATLDGTNLYGWCKLTSANVYEMVRTPYLTNLTVDSGVTLKMNYPLFGNGILTVDGTLDGKGGAASGSTAGTVAPNGWYVAGDAPVAGIASGAGAGDGLSPTTNNKILGGVGGRGAAAWSSAINRKGRGAFGSNHQVLNSLGGKYLTRRWEALLAKFQPSTTSALLQYQGGQPAGSGGKAATGTSCNSGGGGGGGGIVAIAFRNISVGASGVISADGGAGGNAGGTGANAGGGGGGGGGVLGLLYDSLTNAGTLSANGGAGGTSVALGTTPTKAVGMLFAQSNTSSFETTQAGVSSRLYRVSQTVSIGIGAAKDTLYLVAVLTTAGTLENPTVTGWGLTWNLINSVDYKTIATPTWRLSLYYAYGTPVITSDTYGANSYDILLTYTNAPTTTNVTVYEIQNATGTIVQNATNRKNSGASGLTVTLGSAVSSANNAIFGIFALDNWATRTAGSGFTLIADYAGAGSQYMVGEMSYNDTTVDVTGSTPAGAGIAIEISAIGAMESGIAGQDGEVIHFINKE